MDKRISYYNVVPQTGIEHWEQARAAYGEYCSEDTAFHFDFGSRKEEEFCTFCRERGISLIKKSFVKVTGKSIYDYPFMRLHLKNDRFYTNWHSDQKNMNAVYEYYSQFLDLSQVCDLKLNPDGTSEGGECYSGLRQVRKVVVDSVQSKRFDVMRSYYPLNRIILISRKFKDLIESAGLTGCKILPCLKAGQKYTDEEREIDFESETLDREADFFQLHFTDETNRPAKLGNVLQPGRFGGPCPKCDYWHRHSLRDDGEYRDAFQSIRDLKDMDFQYYIRINTTNRGLAQLKDPEFIISNRAYRIIKEHKLKGVTYWLYGKPEVVEILDYDGLTKEEIRKKSEYTLSVPPTRSTAPDATEKTLYQESETDAAEVLYDALIAVGFTEAVSLKQGSTRPSVRVLPRPASDETMAVGQSKFGGLPDVPEMFDWPVREGRPLSFLAQINLEEAAKVEGSELLPSQGALLFFYDLVALTEVEADGDPTTWRVIYLEDTKNLLRAELPEGLEGNGELFSMALTLQVEQTFDDTFEYPTALTPETANDDWNKYAEIMTEHHWGIRETRKFHRLLGHPDIIQGEMKDSKEWQLLFQMDSEDDSEYGWGDSGRLYFWIKKDDLKSRRFDDVWMEMQCH